MISADGTSRPIVFLDRDGTIIEDRHYLHRVEDIVLLPGAADGIRVLNAAGVLAVVVTNQSGVARGLFTAEQYHAVQNALDDILAREGAHLDATYHCPHHPDFSGPCECRKPGTLLFKRALADLRADTSRIAYVGDRWRDLAAAREFGGIGMLVPSPRTPEDERVPGVNDVHVVPSLDVAVYRILQSWHLSPTGAAT